MKTKFYNLIILIVIIVLFTGCSSKKRSWTNPSDPTEFPTSKGTGGSFSGTYAVNFTSSGVIFVDDTSTSADFDYNGTNFITPNVTSGIINLYKYTLDTIGSVTTYGYTNSTTAYAYYCYAIKTIEGNYVKIYISSLSSSTKYVRFDYVYQPNGSAYFSQ